MVQWFVLVTHRNRNVHSNFQVIITSRTNASTVLPNNITLFITVINYQDSSICFYLSISCLFVMHAINLQSHNPLGSGFKNYRRFFRGCNFDLVDYFCCQFGKRSRFFLKFDLVQTWNDVFAVAQAARFLIKISPKKKILASFFCSYVASVCSSLRSRWD